MCPLEALVIETWFPVVIVSPRSTTLWGNECHSLGTLVSYLRVSYYPKRMSGPESVCLPDLSYTSFCHVPFIVITWQQTGEAEPSTMYLTKATYRKKERLTPGSYQAGQEAERTLSGFHLPLCLLMALSSGAVLLTFRVGLSTKSPWKHPYWQSRRSAVLSQEFN